MTALEIVYPYVGIYSSKHLEYRFRLLKELVKTFLSWLLVLSQYVLLPSYKIFVVVVELPELNQLI